MTYTDSDASDFSRRSFLAAGGTIAAAGALGSLVDPLEAFGATKWPKGRLGSKDAVRVRPSQFMPVSQFKAWHREVDRIGPKGQRGLRATGSSHHENYIENLRDDLKRAGVGHVALESLSMKRWQVSSWSLSILAGTGAGPVRVSSYIPYSGSTPAHGVSAPLAYVAPGASPAPGSLAGKIAVFDVPLTVVPLSFFTSLGYKGTTYDPKKELVGTREYKRPYLNGVEPLMEKLKSAGAIGAVGVLDFPAAGADGSYFPYDGIIRSLPGLYVDRATGATLKGQAQAGLPARLTLPAQVKTVKTRNLVGIIPGRSKQLVTLHCHTDGSNAIEDNAPGAIVAMSQYLARLPQKSLPCSVMVLLTTGHFAGGNGAEAFIRRHKNDLVKRTNAALTIEHLGLKEWNEVAPGRMGFTGRNEPGGMFAPGARGLVSAGAKALRHGKMSPAGVLKPLNPNAPGTANNSVWPGEGQYLYGQGRIPTANYITGPTYLLNWGIKTTDKVNFNRVRTEAMAFTEMVLRLGRTPRSQLRRYALK